MEIELAEGTNAAYEQMLTDFAAGKCTYDVVGVDNALGSLYTMDTLAAQGYFYPLDGQPHVQESLAHMLPLLQDLVTIDGIPYALPFIARFKVLDYNAQLYEAVETGRLVDIQSRRSRARDRIAGGTASAETRHLPPGRSCWRADICRRKTEVTPTTRYWSSAYSMPVKRTFPLIPKNLCTRWN